VVFGAVASKKTSRKTSAPLIPGFMEISKKTEEPVRLVSRP
jgi:hypothetical protein